MQTMQTQHDAAAPNGQAELPGDSVERWPRCTTAVYCECVCVYMFVCMCLSMCACDCACVYMFLCMCVHTVAIKPYPLSESIYYAASRLIMYEHGAYEV